MVEQVVDKDSNRKMITKEKKEMEYELAPSGFVHLYNYKEPFMDFKGGFGYEGVLLYDGNSSKVQCHLCGEWFHTLGNHINKEHGINAKNYKITVGLRQTTALISEEHRELLISNAKTSKYKPEERAKNLIKHKKGSTLSKEVIMKSAETRSAYKNVREAQNLRGTCPLQILDRIQYIAERTGGEVTQAEVVRHIYKPTIINLYGSVKNAIELANVKMRGNKRYISKEMAMELLKNFYHTHNRMPTTSDTKRKLLPSWGVYKRHFGSFRNAKKQLLETI